MKNYRAKKSLGQNFLKSALALNKIIEAGEIKDTDVILEIGPGKGALTEKLLEKAGRVIAVEKDGDLLQFLQEKFAPQIQSGTLVLVHEDILKLRITNYELKNYKIIANIPYNITGAIFKKFLTGDTQPELMVLMVQHEVAKRIVARDKKESILSMSVKAYGEPKIIMKVPARYFSPAPKVDSAVIKISNISRKLFLSPSASHPPLSKITILERGQERGYPPRLSGTPQEGNNEEKFLQVVKAGFAHKRKVLISNLKDLCGRQDLPHLREVFKELKLSEKIRAEDLTLSDWINLTSSLSSCINLAK